MKLHTILDRVDIATALAKVKLDGLVANDIEFTEFVFENSRTLRADGTKNKGYIIKLGTWDVTSGPTKKRRYTNSGQYGADHDGLAPYAASYDEWGWFIADLFKRDPEAVFGQYKSQADFHATTCHKYHTEVI